MNSPLREIPNELLNHYNMNNEIPIFDFLDR